MELPIKVPLTRPIVVEGNSIDCLLVDEPDLGSQIDYADLEASLSKPPTAKDAARVNLFWLSRLTGHSEDTIRRVKDSDLPALNAAAEAVMQMRGDEDGGDAGNETPAK